MIGRFVHTAAVIATVLAVIGPVAAHGQTDTDLSSLRDAIERNGELLERARELVNETRSFKARESLDAAEKLHAESIRNFQAGNFAIALQITRRAREVILQTISLAKRDAQLEHGARRAVERAADRLEQGRALLIEQGSNVQGPERKLLEEAHSQLQRARDNLRERMYEVAMRLAESSEGLSIRAITMLKRDVVAPDAIRLEIDKTDRILERLGDEIDRGGGVYQMFEEARDLQQKAKDHFRDGRPLMAADMTRKSRQIATRAFRMSVASDSEENVEQAIRLTDMLLLEARDLLADRGTGPLERHIDQAEKVQSEAKEQLRAGHFERALRSTLRARDILKDALGSVNKPPNRRQVREALVETDAVLGRLEDASSRADNGEVTGILRRAVSQQQRAWKDLEDDKLRSALAHTKLARNLARRAFRVLNDEEP